MLQEKTGDRIKRTTLLQTSESLSRGLLDSGRQDAAALLLEQHDVEAVKVRQRTASLDGSALLGPARGGPLLGDTSLVEELLDGGRASTAGKTGHSELGEREVLEGEHLAGDTGGGGVDDGLVMSEEVCRRDGRSASYSCREDSRHDDIVRRNPNDSLCCAVPAPPCI